MSTTKTIPFAELKKLNDSNSFVWTALKFDPKDLKPIQTELVKLGFLPKDASLASMQKIDGNVEGDDGRTDVLFKTVKATHFNPIARLRIEGLTWTSDFIDNYGKDYGEASSWPTVRSDDDDYDDEYGDGGY